MSTKLLNKLVNLSTFGKDIKTIKRCDEEGLLYKMDYSSNYYLLLFLIQKVIKAGCSVFFYKDENNNPMMGRNFDLRHFYKDKKTNETSITGLAVVVKINCKKAKYKSIGIADGVYMHPGHQTYHKGCLDDGKTDLIRTLALPFLFMDGVNEKGLAISIMHLSTDNIFQEVSYDDYQQLDMQDKTKIIFLNNKGQQPDNSDALIKNGTIVINPIDKKAWRLQKSKSTCQRDKHKKSINHTVLMRFILDNCASVKEAIALAENYNIVSLPDADYHLLVGDANGDSAMLEWINNKLVVTQINHGANFYAGRQDHYGYGQQRDQALVKAMKKYPKGMSKEETMKTLEEVRQNCFEDRDIGFTQWSAVYDLKNACFDVCLHMNYDKVYHFSL